MSFYTRLKFLQFIFLYGRKLKNYKKTANLQEKQNNIFYISLYLVILR